MNEVMINTKSDIFTTLENARSTFLLAKALYLHTRSFKELNKINKNKMLS